jgi:hypothetical protein
LKKDIPVSLEFSIFDNPITRQALILKPLVKPPLENVEKIDKRHILTWQSLNVPITKWDGKCSALNRRTFQEGGIHSYAVLASFPDAGLANSFK